MSILRICILASSSAGNATFIASAQSRILIDAGISRREIVTRLAAIGEVPEALDAVLVSHEHSDHICGLFPLMKRFNLTAYVSGLAARAIPWREHDWGDKPPRIRPFFAGTSFRIGDLEIDSFTVPHDSVDPVGFCIRSNDTKVGLVTDLGYIPESVRFHLRGSACLVLESNHDLDMLKVGPYPWSVKQRVMGRSGHLSNDLVSDFILNGLDNSLNTLVLGHLSEHNNHPAIAHMSASQALMRRASKARLTIVEPRAQTEVFQV